MLKIQQEANSLKKYRVNFLKKNANSDHTIVLVPSCKVVLSAPHGVSQIRLGKLKKRELGSITTALYLQNRCGCSLIAKTKNNCDDANFDKTSLYKDSLAGLIKDNDVKYLIDIHSLSTKRDIDINLGIHLGYNINANEQVFDKLSKELKENGFSVAVDKPFMASGNTICNSMRKLFDNLFALQIEINSSITNKVEHFDRYSTLLNLLENWINGLK